MNRVFRSTKKFNIKLLAVILAIAAVFICGCSRPSPSDHAYQPNTVFPAQFTGILKDKKIYLTSVGQSIEMLQLKMNMDAVDGLEFTEDSLLNASEVEEGSVVFVVAGCSIKALTESDLTKESEMLRAEEFVAAAKEGKFTLICWHIGGTARRGSTSDDFIEYLFGGCDLALFKAEGNYDLSLSDWAMAGGVPYCQLDGNLVTALNKLMGDADV